MTDSAVSSPLQESSCELHHEHENVCIPPIAKSKSSVMRLAKEGVLPGHGEIGAGCGDTMTMVCSHCGHVWDGKHQCLRRTCPNCYRAWCARQGHIAGVRLWAGAIKVAGCRPGRGGWRLLHVVVSFPDTGEDICAMRERARQVARKHGIRGGAIIPHPFRTDKEDGQYVPDGYVHFHVIGLASGDVTPGSNNEFFKVVRDARRGDYRGITRYRDAIALVKYLLSHCGVWDGVHSISYFGCLAYNNLNNSTLDEFSKGELSRAKSGFKVRCPNCGSEDVEPLWAFDIEPVLNRMCGPPLFEIKLGSSLDDFG